MRDVHDEIGWCANCVIVTIYGGGGLAGTLVIGLLAWWMGRHG
jgi:hypothetical protein